jgi:DNA polymerase I-like protein with 3'-5' exonuclease and polymerase domains
MTEGLRSGFNIHGTTSGRLSSSGNLNYQNIPRDNKDIKKLFKARPGYKIVFNVTLALQKCTMQLCYLETSFYRKLLLTNLTFTRMLRNKCSIFPEEVNQVKKIHPNERQYAKAITFGIMYQAGPAKIAETVNKDAKAGEEITTAHSLSSLFKSILMRLRSLKKFIDGSNTNRLKIMLLSTLSSDVNADYQKRNPQIVVYLSTQFVQGLIF